MNAHGTASPGTDGRTGVRAALRSRPFVTLLAGYAVSAVGDGMTAVAISWLAIVLARGRDTGLLVGAAVAAYTIPGMVAGLGLGRLLARWDPRLLILAEAVVRAACLGLIAAGALTGVLTAAGYIALLGLSSLLGLLGFTGGLTAVVELLPEAQRVAGNSLLTVSSFAATIVGPALAGLVIAAAGAGVAFAVDAGHAAGLRARHDRPGRGRGGGPAPAPGRAGRRAAARYAAGRGDHPATVSTSAWRGNTFSVSTRCTSGSASRHASASTTSR
jgi:MFS family permease